jgi:hypothetical protein
MVRYVLVHHGPRKSKEDPTVFAVVFAFPAQVLACTVKALTCHTEKRKTERKEGACCVR